jgi:hypothetical protein
MNKSERIVAGIASAYFLIMAVQAIWNIDIAVSSFASKGTMITITGIVNIMDYYHAALLRAFFAISMLGILSIALLIDKGGQP